MNITSIQGVLNKLDDIILWCENASSRQGYFAALYRRMTLAVQQGMQQNAFADASRIEKLDVIFANRYIDAWGNFQNKQTITNGWQTVFTSCGDTNLTVIQHLILGVNTHINLDLAIAAAEACNGNNIFDWQNDYEKINNIIASLINEVQEKLTKIWWPLGLISKITNDRDDAVINFSITAARKAAWANAVALTQAGMEARANYINGIDSTVTALANGIIHPGVFINTQLKMVKMFEYNDVKEIIRLIR